MKTTKQLGIWMDHSVAYLMEYDKDGLSTATLQPRNDEADKSFNAHDESIIQNKEQNQLASFFKSISEVIGVYDEILLFGPTDAKTELFNVLKNDRHFENIKIELKPSDKMTDNQMHSFVNEHFSH
ncbi:MAG: hypothetical protein JXR22_10705 [Prolixibacteraceae bacterium]|nr:hypothetical protein [Prolixibacteraceae bacterium]